MDTKYWGDVIRLRVPHAGQAMTAKKTGSIALLKDSAVASKKMSPGCI